VPRRDGTKGDLYVHVSIRLPTNHDHAKIEKAVEQLQGLYTEDVRAGLKF
jgi:DnaJ-class molecular chaperone